MAGQLLHNYDRALCEYVQGNIRQYLREERFARAARRHLPAALLKHLADRLDLDAEQEWLLLSDNELYELAFTFAGDVPELDRKWVAYELLHQRHVECVREIRAELTRQDAEEWSRACARFAARLEGKRVYLADGIVAAHDWVRYLRRLLRAVGATALLPYPEGQSPTPTNPTPWPLSTPEHTAPPPAPTSFDHLSLERTRRALHAMPAGNGRQQGEVGRAGTSQSPVKWLLNWREILAALELPNCEDKREAVRRLNEAYQGPIFLPGQGGQPKADKARLLTWWNGLEGQFQEVQRRRRDAQTTAERQHPHGRDGNAIPDIGGGVKRRRKDRKR